MGLVVQKFGGTSVAGPERLQAVARRLVAARDAGNDVVGVLSAMGGATDDLVDLAHQISPAPDPRDAIAALAANEAQFYNVSATGSSLGAMAGGLDLAFVAGLVNKLDGYFAVAPKIRTPEDLKGKTIGIQSIGGGIWMFTQMALDHWALSAERDKIQLRVIGDQSVLAQAMSSGAIDGAVLGYAFSRVAQKNGGRILAELPKLNIPYQGIGMVARRSLVQSSPDSVEKTLRALVRSHQFIQDKNNQAAVLGSLRRWLRLPPADGGEELYERMKLLYDRRVSPSADGIQNAIRILSKTDAKFAKLKASELIDDRIARKVERDLP
jgi:ABC-type nitrate/sulfonate/bicarbonate transport system substrate-binding protein